MPSEPLAASYFLEKTFRSNYANLLKKIVATETDPAPLQGMGQVKKAQELFEAGKFKEARALADKTKRLYNVRLRSGGQFDAERKKILKACQDLINRIDADQGIQDHLIENDAAHGANKVASLEKRAARDERAYLDLYRALESIARRYPESEAGKRCAERIKQLRADSNISEMIDRESERRFIVAALQLADQYEKNGHADRAQAELDMLRQKYPHTSLAELRQRAQ